jgi:hypothetical protein
MPGAND